MTLPLDQITGLILAGGRGSRMAGVDKGLQPYRGTPLVVHAMQRLQPQVGELMISANRNVGTYESLGVPVRTDAGGDYPGPLGGFLAGLEHCRTEWLITVPCDAPLFPLDLVARLAEAATSAQVRIALPKTRHEGGVEQAQPVFCLLRRDLRSGLIAYLQSGERKIDRWTRQEHALEVLFDRPGDERAFFNINTLDDLQN